MSRIPRNRNIAPYRKEKGEDKGQGGGPKLKIFPEVQKIEKMTVLDMKIA